MGRGRVLFAAMPFERQLDRAGRLTTTDAESFYRCLADRAGAPPPLDCDVADVELIPMPGPGGTTLVINHGERRVTASLLHRSAGGHLRRSVDLDAKSWALIAREA